MVRNMVYGIVSAKDVQSDFEYLKSKKVLQRKLVTADRIKQLMEVLSAGDIVHVVSVDIPFLLMISTLLST